jgi:hypothetical protein
MLKGLDNVKGLLQSRSGINSLRSFLESEQAIGPSILLQALEQDLVLLACGTSNDITIIKSLLRLQWKLFGTKNRGRCQLSAKGFHCQGADCGPA